MWNYTGQKRPSFADQPGPGQESVWDYPRPPALVNSDPEGAGWFFKIELSDPSELDGLMDAVAYKAFVDSL